MYRYKIVTLEKVNDFVESLDKTRRVRVQGFRELFKQYGKTLPNKYLKKIRKNLWELRPGDVRLFLAIRGNVGYELHAIIKKTNKIPKKDLKLAIKRQSQYL